SVAMGTPAPAVDHPVAHRDRNLAAGARRHSGERWLLVGPADGGAGGAALLPRLPRSAGCREVACSALRRSRSPIPVSTRAIGRAEPMTEASPGDWSKGE